MIALCLLWLMKENGRGAVVMVVGGETPPPKKKASADLCQHSSGLITNKKQQVANDPLVSRVLTGSVSARTGKNNRP